MNSDKLYIARIQFKNRILSSYGQTFEDFFIRVMQAFDSEFRPVKPQGREGDKKNDGFNKKKGQYYQVYSPESNLNKEKISLNKLDNTIKELVNYWQEISPIKEFFWVYNDRYSGIYPSVEKELSNIEKKYKIKAEPFLCKTLEDVFLSLPESEIIDILGGYLPDYNNIEDVPISILGEVIDFLINYKFELTKIIFPDEVNFEKKIRFNNLSKTFGRFLINAFHQDYIITKYFTYNSKFSKEELKIVFSNFYKNALKEIPDEFPEKSDMIFDFILKTASPRNNKAFKDAVLILMAHYFESCDIFEEPKKPKQTKLF